MSRGGRISVGRISARRDQGHRGDDGGGREDAENRRERARDGGGDRREARAKGEHAGADDEDPRLAAEQRPGIGAGLGDVRGQQVGEQPGAEEPLCQGRTGCCTSSHRIAATAVSSQARVRSSDRNSSQACR